VMNYRSAYHDHDSIWSMTDNGNTGSTTTNGSIAYVYDNVSNRLTRTSSVSDISNESSGYDDNDRLLSDGWDANGNTVTGNGNGYAYDSENRLVSLNNGQARYT